MNKKKKCKGTSGLQWYRDVCKFLTELDCYLTTPVMDRTIFDELLSFTQKNTCSIFRLKTEYKKYGLYVSRGKRGNSILIAKPVVERFCQLKDYVVDGLLTTNQIVAYSAKDFRDIRHFKNVYQSQIKEDARKRRYYKNKEIINSPLFNEEQKKRAMLDIWSDKKLENNEIASTESENILYSKLYGVYKKRVRKQQKFIIRNRVYFVDIYMKAYKVAIEVDGGYHNSPQQIEKDKQKDLDLSTLGFLVIRVKNEDVRKRFGFIKNILEKRHKDIIKGVKVSTGIMRI